MDVTYVILDFPVANLSIMEKIFSSSHINKWEETG
jgi:hypothetical protein